MPKKKAKKAGAPAPTVPKIQDDKMADLNFRVPKSFKKASKQAALDQDKTMKQFLQELFAGSVDTSKVIHPRG